MGILSPGNSFAERILFWVLLLEKMPNRVLNLLPVALPKGRMGLVFWVLLLEIVVPNCTRAIASRISDVISATLGKSVTQMPTVLPREDLSTPLPFQQTHTRTCAHTTK